jgi:hypothetical protein
VRLVRASEWRWLIGVAIGLLVLTLIPLLVAAAVTPAGSVFTGYLVIARDAFVYQGIWRAGWEGAWLFQPGYTSEPVPGVLLYPWYLWSGHLLGWLPGPFLYHVFRLAADALLLLTLYLLCAQLFRARLVRRWAFVLAALGGGIGVLLPDEALRRSATEMASPGTSVADLISMAPHLPLALALLCWVYVVALRTRRHLNRLELASELLALVSLELIYPQLALLALATILAWAVALRHRLGIILVAIGGLATAPYLVYLLLLTRTASDALRVIRPSLEVGDPFGFLVLSHLVATGLIGLALLRRRLRSDLLMPAFWIAGMTLFMFVPGVDRLLGRVFLASSIPFGLCAAPGLLSLLRGIRRKAWRRRVLVLALAGSSLFGIFSLMQPFWIAALRLDARAEYEPAGEAALLEWLRPQVRHQDVVLTTYLDGVFVPAATPARAFVGHPDMTIEARRKASESLAFFESWSTGRRELFLDSNGIDYVLTTNRDYAARLMEEPRLRLIRTSEGAALFKVVP